MLKSNKTYFGTYQRTSKVSVWDHRPEIYSGTVVQDYKVVYRSTVVIYN